MTESFIQVMSRIPPAALAVFVFLEDRSKMDTKIGVTQQEVSRATGYSVGVVRSSLGWLESPTYHDSQLQGDGGLGSFLTVKKFSNAYRITLLEPYVDVQRWVRFTFEDYDSRRIETLEKELRRLARDTGERNKLSMYVKGDTQNMIAEIEGDLGRNLTIHEAFLLGEVSSRVAKERILLAWRRKAHAMKNPVVGIVAMFKNEAFGNLAKVEEEKERVYDRIVPNHDPV